MAQFRDLKSTICALATPSGFGGISVIRVSGDKALEITKKLCPALPPKPESHKVYLTNLEFQDQVLDEVLVTTFHKGKSYTGDETCEISSHGNPAIAQEILNALISSGCRMAERGEFTYRAFMSGNIDLVQAESVLSLIESESKRSREVALRQLKGALSEELAGLQDKITRTMANFEVSIDFTTEDIDVLDYKEINNDLTGILTITDKLISSYQGGHILKNGFKVALVGEPNVGKSSLFNQFVAEDRAIVTEVSGTTRDVLEGSTLLGGVPVSFVDTAGVHSTEDIVEKIGIQRALNEIQSSDLIFYVIDLSRNINQIDETLLKAARQKRVCFIGNKSDISKFENFNDSLSKHMTLNFPNFEWEKTFEVSSLNSKNIEGLKKYISKIIEGSFTEDSNVVLQARQYELLSNIKNCILKTQKLLETKESPEFLSFELRDAFESVQELLGQKVDDQIMDRVFNDFCIGK